MKHLLFTILLLAHFAQPLTARARTLDGYPKLFFNYSWLFDQAVCGPTGVAQSSRSANSQSQTSHSNDSRLSSPSSATAPAPSSTPNPDRWNNESETWAQEAIAKEPYFTQTWESNAPDLFTVLFAKFKGRFSRKEMSATLSVCPKVRSFSSPLVLKVTWYLKSYMGDKPVLPQEGWITLVYHELLHTWVDENLSQSKLLEKYKDEPSAVKNHLHLMALEQFTYINAGKPELLKWIEIDYRKAKDAYARSWEIVQKEGYQAFIAEFK